MITLEFRYMWVDICTSGDGMGMERIFGGDGRGWKWNPVM